MKKVATLAALVLLAVSLYGQNVVELSRREKARREALEGQPAKVVTNADLAALKKTPAITVKETPGQEATNAETATAETPNTAGETPANQRREDMVPVVAPNGPSVLSPQVAASFNPQANLEAQYKAACDSVDSLTSQMNLLWQQFYNLNNMQTQGHVQQEIDETYQKLLKAQAEQTRLKARLDALKSAPKR